MICLPKLLTCGLMSQTSSTSLFSAGQQQVEIVVGNTIAHIPRAKARLARTGEPKIFAYKLYAEIIGGDTNAIRQIEFFPDIVDHTYLPPSYKDDSNGPVFATEHDCYGMSTAHLKIQMADGQTKHIFTRIRNTNSNESTWTLTYGDSHGLELSPMTNRAFGVEMEFVAPKSFRPGIIRDKITEVTKSGGRVTGYNTKTMKAWKVETDNSIQVGEGMHGVEIVSPILRGAEGLRDLKNVANVATAHGGTANIHCGLHVHIDLTSVSFDGLQRICKSWIKYEEALDSLIDPSRRNSMNKYCLNNRENMRFRSLTNKEALTLIHRQTSREGLARLMNAHPSNRNRYFKLNLQNLVRQDSPRNTIEFRGHEGTCDAVAMEHWVRLLNRFVERALASKKIVAFHDEAVEAAMRARLFRSLKDPALQAYYDFDVAKA